MEHSIALVTGTTSGLGYAAARLLAIKGYRQVIVTGRSLARIQETAAQLATETNTQVFTPLELDLDRPSSVRSALAAPVKRGRPIDFLLLNAGMVPGKKRVLTAAGVEAAQAPLQPRASYIGWRDQGFATDLFRQRHQLVARPRDERHLRSFGGE